MNRIILQIPDESTTSARSFDYSLVSADVARFLKGQAERVRQQHVRSIIQIGKSLVGAKHYLSHGAFTTWVESEVGMPARTAQGYMRVAQWASDKGAAVAQLPPSVLYLISAPSAPEKFVSDVLGRASNGEKIRASEIRKEFRGHRKVAQKLHDERAGGASPVAAEQSNDDDAQRNERKRILAEAIRTMARGLTRADFDRIREMMTTSIRVIDDLELEEAITAAFWDVESSMQRPCLVEYHHPITT